MKRRGISFAACLLLVSGLVGGLAFSASAALSDCGTTGKFCGWQDANYGTKIYTLSGSAGVTEYLDSNDRDLTSSVRNRTDDYWCAVNEHTFQPDESVAEYQPGAQISYVGDLANDKIDHYDIKNNSGNCYNPIF